VDAERGDVAAMIRAVVILLIVGAASRADARPKIPKALAGVPLADADSDAELVWVKHDGTFTLGGKKVIAFRQSYRREESLGHGDAHVVATVQLGVVDAVTKALVYKVDIQTESYTVVVGERNDHERVAYESRWRDENADGEPELHLTRTAGDGPAEHVLQVRFGQMVPLSPEMLRCPRAPEDTLALGEAVAAEVAPTMVARFVARLDDGDPADEVLCAYADAVAASRLEAPMPAPGELFTLAPIATGCPGLAWALRHGRELAPTRTMVFLDTRGRLARVIVRDGALTASVLDLDGDGGGSAVPIVWLERWVIDDRLWVFAEIGSSRGTRVAVVVDPHTGLVEASKALSEHATARLEHSTGARGIFELVVDAPELDGTLFDGAPGQATKRTVVFRREATSWH
jgi:hypothetical protein